MALNVSTVLTMFDPLDLTTEAFPTYKSAIEKYGTSILRLCIHSPLPRNPYIPCANLKEDMVEEQVPPSRCTDVQFQLTQCTDGKNYWWQYIRL